MNAEFKQGKKVCIIVPVYNAEKYLGYCLNSIMSQTYMNWEAILVNDGSTDSSLDICRQYEKIDDRFKVLSKANGGVSSARNFGLKYADGEYLIFLDSDDCLAQDSIEKQVELAEMYNSPLVMMDIMQVDFSNPAADKNMLTSAWLKKSPYKMNAQEFRAKKMRLVWFTVLLECLHAKLYDLKLWKKLDLVFPEELSLGEDFVTNMKYFDACENVVFLKECGHYYNCIMGSNSLTQKYRSDLFENKMLLIDALDQHLGGVENLSSEEKDAFYCYVASNGLSCIERLALDAPLNQEEKILRLKEILSHSVFAESIEKASYIPERLVVAVNYVQEQQYERAIAYIAGREYEKSTMNQPGQEQNVQCAMVNSLVNRAIRKGIRVLRKPLKKGRMHERLTRWEKEIGYQGLRNMISSHIYDHKSVRNNHLEYQLASTKEQMLADIGWKIADGTHQVGEKIESGTRCIEEKIESGTRRVEEKVYQIDANINGYVWYSEQRMMEYAIRKDINELRQKRKAIIIASAEHANIGDSAITLAEQQILTEQFPDYYQVEISTYEFEKMETYLHAILNPMDIIFIQGGGNIGDLYVEEEELHRKIVAEFPNNKMVIFPQTIAFSNTEKGKIETEKSAKVYNNHKDFTLFVRGEHSYNFAKKHFYKAKTILMPDMVHVLRRDYRFVRKGILLCLREDEEAKLGRVEKDQVTHLANGLSDIVNRSTNIHSEDVPREVRAYVVHKEFMRFAQHQVVITDRLHGMIFSAVTGTPCVVLASCNHKIFEYYNAFFKDSKGVFFLGNELENLEETVKQAMQMKEVQYPIFDQEPHGKFREYLDF